MQTDTGKQGTDRFAARGPASTLLFDPKRIDPGQWLQERLGPVDLLSGRAASGCDLRKSDEGSKPERRPSDAGRHLRATSPPVVNCAREIFGDQPG